MRCFAYAPLTLFQPARIVWWGLHACLSQGFHRDLSCRRAACAGTTNFSFLANERGLPDEPMFDHETALYVTMLRNPAERYLSQYHHMREAAADYHAVSGTQAPMAPAGYRAILSRMHAMLIQEDRSFFRRLLS